MMTFDGEVTMERRSRDELPRTSTAFSAASWGAFAAGAGCYLVGLFEAGMQLNEKGYYLAVLLLGLFSAVSLQKAVRDAAEGIKVTGLYSGICWFAFAASILLLLVGLWNATLALSEKGFYGVSFLMALFAAIAVQRNVRDAAWERRFEDSPTRVGSAES